MNGVRDGSIIVITVIIVIIVITMEEMLRNREESELHARNSINTVMKSCIAHLCWRSQVLIGNTEYRIVL